MGSAQLRERDAILQHGAVLLEDDQRLVHALAGAVPEPLPEIPLSEALERLVTWEEVADAVEAASRAWSPEWRPLSAAEIEARAARHGPHFRDPAWSWES